MGGVLITVGFWIFVLGWWFMSLQANMLCCAFTVIHLPVPTCLIWWNARCHHFLSVTVSFSWFSVGCHDLWFSLVRVWVVVGFWILCWIDSWSPRHILLWCWTTMVHYQFILVGVWTKTLRFYCFYPILI